MASLLPGYEYDIFISYRQKDNKHDGWVTEFVDNLKGELESTFKEEISVYFDINPHDGLLETHDVEASLKDKLKCLIFIPIISRTYCDPKSFAWEHEFKAFVEEASQDQFGLKVKLPNGNVANRVLPVRIYDLENTDIKLCESVLGSVLRGVEFIYKEPGVNRPLKSDDDEKINLNKTKYRNQINKVANAIKEIISGLKTEPVAPGKEKIQQREPLEEVMKEERMDAHEKPVKSNKRKLLSGIAILAILIIAGLITYPKTFKKEKFKNLIDSDGRISVAVMPFKNLTVDTKFDIWQEGLQNLLITSLSNSEGLSVRQYETINQIIGNAENINYASITPSLAGNIALKLKANTVIIGNIHKSGHNVRITANLMDSRSEEIYKSYAIEGNTEDDFFPIIDSLSKFIKDYLEIKNLKQLVVFDYKNVNTTSAEAYKYFIQGKKYHGRSDYNSALDLYLKSIHIDTNFVSPMLMLTYIYGDIGKSEQSRIYAYKAYSRINLVPHDIQLLIKEVKAAIDKKPEEQIEYMKLYLEINPYSNEGFYTIGWASMLMDQWQNAIDAFEKGIEMNKQIGSKFRFWIWYYILLGNAYHDIGEHKKEMEIYENGLHLWPGEEPQIIYYQAVCALSRRDTVEANEYLKKIKIIGQLKNWSESEILLWLANIHFQANLFNKADQLYRRALFIDPQNIVIKNDLAYLLINNDIDINEGIELIKHVLEVTPDNFDFLYTYGLGLYKQGKFDKALEILNKSWESRPYYNHDHFQYLEAAKKAVANQKNN